MRVGPSTSLGRTELGRLICMGEGLVDALALAGPLPFLALGEDTYARDGFAVDRWRKESAAAGAAGAGRQPGTDRDVPDHPGRHVQRQIVRPGGAPASPADGQCFIIGSAPTGAWAGQAKAIAGYAAGGWRFVAAVAGMSAFGKASEQTATYDGASWVVGTVKGAKLELAGAQWSGRGWRLLPIRAAERALMSRRGRQSSRSSTGCGAMG